MKCVLAQNVHSHILEEKTQNFASDVLPLGLFVIHDTSGGGQHDISTAKTFLII